MTEDQDALALAATAAAEAPSPPEVLEFPRDLLAAQVLAAPLPAAAGVHQVLQPVEALDEAPEAVLRFLQPLRRHFRLHLCMTCKGFVKKAVEALEEASEAVLNNTVLCFP